MTDKTRQDKTRHGPGSRGFLSDVDHARDLFPSLPFVFTDRFTCCLLVLELCPQRLVVIRHTGYSGRRRAKEGSRNEERLHTNTMKKRGGDN